MDNQTLISIIAIIVSGAVGIAGATLNIRKFWASDTIDRAARRTTALQMISDEEYALSQVETECKSIELLILSNQTKLEDNYEHLKSEADRIVLESNQLLTRVKEKRKQVEGKIASMSSAEIEHVISEAYQGRMEAEAQLRRTTKSRDDTIYLYLS
jgi:hypothetical protein